MSNAIKINVNGTWKDVGTKGSLKLDGTGDYISSPDHSDWDITTGAYTISLFFRLTKIPDKMEGLGESMTLMEQGQSSSYFWTIRLSSNVHTGYVGLSFLIGNSTWHLAKDVPMVIDTWYHLAFCKLYDEGLDKWVSSIYLDGTQLTYSGTEEDKHCPTNYNAPLQIGYGTYYGDYLHGYVDEVLTRRLNIFNAAPNVGLTNIIAVPVREFASFTDEGLLLHLNTNLDDSTGRHTWTAYGDAQIDHAIYKDLSGASSLKVNINGVWKTIAGMQININGTWKTVF